MIFVIPTIVIILVTAVLLLGYPLFILLLKHVKKKTWKRESMFPSLSVIIPSHGSAMLGEKISNTLIQYPRDKMQVIVVYSGKDRNVLKELRNYHVKGLITLIEEKQRSGKANAINLGLQKATGDICVITDRDSLLEKEALKNLVSSFADNNVGAVSGELVYTGHSPLSAFHKLFFNKYKKAIKNWEAEIDSCSYAPGELLAFRKELIKRLPHDVIADDYHILLRVREKGYRCVSEPKAIVYERPPQRMEGTEKRTRRVITGTFLEASRFKDMIFNRKFGLFGLLIFPGYVIRLALLPFLAASLIISLALELVEVGLMLSTPYLIALILVTACSLFIGRNFLKYSFAIMIGMMHGIIDYVAGKSSSSLVWQECKET